jgi:hypothetical protein
MEGFAAFSLACNLLQVAEASRNFIRTARELRASINGATSRNHEFWLAAEKLRHEAKTILENGQDKILQGVIKQCEGAVEEHLAMLETLRLKNNASRLAACLMAFKAMYNRQDLEASQSRIDRLGSQLANHVITTRLPRMDLNLQTLLRRTAESEQAVLSNLDKSKMQLAGVEEVVKKNLEATTEVSDAIKTLHMWYRREEAMQQSENCLQALAFPELESREAQLRDPHQQTFRWIFVDEKQSLHQTTPSKTSNQPDEELPTLEHRSRFRHWLRSDHSDDNVFWVSGKPGAGKSTLMKFIAHDEGLKQNLQSWVKTDKLLLLRYFFWKSGSLLQRSSKGLLQTLLFKILVQDPDMVHVAFPGARWKTSRPQFELSQSHLSEALRRVLESAPSRQLRLFILIDGLDEFDGRNEYSSQISDEHDLIVFLRLFHRLPSVKLCVSSRPLNAFKEEFGQNTSRCLRIHDLTRSDIRVYVKDVLEHNSAFKRLAQTDCTYNELVEEIIDAAKGVFLWVYYACRSLGEGLTNADRVEDLRQRLRDLPDELNELYKHILSTIDSKYWQSASRILLTLTKSVYHPRLPLLGCEYLDEEHYTAALKRDHLTRTALSTLTHDWMRRLDARCKGLVDVHWENRIKYVDGNMDHDYFFGASVTYSHRTVRDFLRSPVIEHKLVIGAGKEFEPITARVKAGMAVMADFVSMVHWEDPMPPGVKIPAARGEFLWLVNGISRYVMNSYLDFIEGKRPHTLIASLYPVMDGLLERSLSSGKLTVAEFHIITRWRLSGLPFRASALHLMIYIKRNENFERMITKDPGVVKQSTGLFPLLSFAILCLVKQGGVWYDDSFVLTLLKLGANPNEPYQGWTAWTTLVGTMYWLRGGSGRKYEVIQDIIRLFLEHGAETSRQCLFVGEIEHCGPRKNRSFVHDNATLRIRFNSSLEKESGLFPEASDIKSIVKKEFLVSAGSLANYCCGKDVCESQFEKLEDILGRVKQELLAQFDALPESEKLPPVEVNSADQKGSG